MPIRGGQPVPNGEETVFLQNCTGLSRNVKLRLTNSCLNSTDQIFETKYGLNYLTRSLSFFNISLHNCLEFVKISVKPEMATAVHYVQ